MNKQDLALRTTVSAMVESYQSAVSEIRIAYNRLKEVQEQLKLAYTYDYFHTVHNAYDLDRTCEAEGG